MQAMWFSFRQPHTYVKELTITMKISQFAVHFMSTSKTFFSHVIILMDQESCQELYIIINIIIITSSDDIQPSTVLSHQ